MPKYQVTSPDGKTWEVNAPDGASQDQVLEYAKSQWSAQPIEPPVAVKAGRELSGIPRQLGLTARYALEGPAQAAQIVTEPLRYGIEKATGVRGRPLSQAASGFADFLGLPSPEGANERVVGDATRLVSGAGGLSAAGRASQGVGGMVGKAGDFFASNPAQQAISAAGAGLAGGSVREAGGGAVPQALAALVGGVGAPMGVSGTQSAANTLRNAVSPRTSPQQVEQQIQLVMQRSGVDWAAVPERVKQAMRSEVARAMQSGEDLNADAMRRLLDFQRVGATPTRGMLTQDPVQITREQNLAKTGANSSDLVLQALPRVQGQNTERLLSNLDDLGARNAPDAFATGQSVLGSLRRNADASRGRIDSLYSAARDTQGRSAPLDGASFTSRANQLLDEGLLGGALPPSVAQHMNRIAQGEVPFTVDYAEQLKTAIGNLQRAANDGQTRMALGRVRQALDETPLMPARQVNPGNLPAVPGTVPQSPATLGQESISAFNRARQANRAFMQRVEQTPALQAALDGAEPDRFVQRFITGQGATFADVTALRRAIGNDPQTLQAVRANIAAHLRSAATNGTDDVAKFSPASYNRALENIGDRKLSAFFEPADIEQLRAVGRVGTLMKSQPDGAAVNNSNSGALMLGKGLDILDRIAGRIPLGLDSVIQGTVRGIQQGKAMNVPRSLLIPEEPVGLLQRLGVPAVYGGLLATQPVD